MPNPWTTFNPGLRNSFTAPSRSVIARGLVNQPMDEPFFYHTNAASALGGYRGASLGALGAIDLIPGVTFNNHDAFNDFVNGVDLRGGVGRWGGMSQGILNQLSRLLSEAGNYPSASIAADNVLEQANRLARTVQQYQPWGGFLGLSGRSDAQDRQYNAAMQELKRHLSNSVTTLTRAINADKAAGATLEPSDDYEPPELDTPSSIPDTSTSYVNRLLGRDKPTAEQVASGNVAAPTGAAAGSSPLIPLVIGGGALVILLGGFFLLRR